MGEPAPGVSGRVSDIALQQGVGVERLFGSSNPSVGDGVGLFRNGVRLGKVNVSYPVAMTYYRELSRQRLRP